MESQLCQTSHTGLNIHEIIIYQCRQAMCVCVLNMLNASTKWIRTDAVWGLPVWQIWRHRTVKCLGSGDLTSHHTVLSVSNCWQWHYSRLSPGSCGELSQSTLKRNPVTVSGFRDNIVLSTLSKWNKHSCGHWAHNRLTGVKTYKPSVSHSKTLQFILMQIRCYPLYCKVQMWVGQTCKLVSWLDMR